MLSTASDPVRDAYATIAPHYEAFTAAYPHDTWLRELERLARRYGLRERRVLDVGCGTGKSLRPLLHLGYAATGTDISPQMLAVARERLTEVKLVEADVRRLPALGPFPWVIAINDTFNYLLGDGDLVDAMRSVARVLAPGGLLTFDLNTATGHRLVYEATWAVEAPGRFMCWQGRGWDPDQSSVAASDIMIFSQEAGAWQQVISRHEQRWWSDDDVLTAAREAGLELVARHGQTRGASLEDEFGEARHTKIVYFLRAPAEDTERG